MTCPGKGEYLRRKGNGNVPRTPSVELPVMEDAVLPVAPGDSETPNLESLAEMGGLNRAQSAPTEQQKYAQEQSRLDPEKQKHAFVPQSRGGELRNYGWGRVMEEGDNEDDFDEGTNGDSEKKSKGGTEKDNEGYPIAVDGELDIGSKSQFNLAEQLQLRPALRITIYKRCYLSIPSP